MKRFLLLLSVVGLLLASTFLAGAVAHKTCTFPFCEGYLQTLRTAAPGVGSDYSSKSFAVAEEGIELLSVDTLKTFLHKKVIARRYSLNERMAERMPGNHNAMGSARDGGIDVLGNDLIVASKDGQFFLLEDGNELRHLPIVLPLTQDSFNSYVATTKYAHAGPHWAPVISEWFGVKDILVMADGADRYMLFASHHHWNDDRDCFTLRVSARPLQHPVDTATMDTGSWDSLYETTPCLELKDQKHPFAGLQAGGRLVSLSPDSLLVSVGDHERDGMYGDSLPQDDRGVWEAHSH